MLPSKAFEAPDEAIIHARFPSAMFGSDELPAKAFIYPATYSMFKMLLGILQLVSEFLVLKLTKSVMQIIGYINTLRSRQDGRNIPDIVKCVSFNENI